ncbi:hypothetical protein ABPG72_021464 [Tetrahymena utriculariae]
MKLTSKQIFFQILIIQAFFFIKFRNKESLYQIHKSLKEKSFPYQNILEKNSYKNGIITIFSNFNNNQSLINCIFFHLKLLLFILSHLIFFSFTFFNMFSLFFELAKKILACQAFIIVLSNVNYEIIKNHDKNTEDNTY